MRVVAIVPAAGSGARMGGVKKQFMDIAGKPMLAWTLLRLASSPLIDGIVLAVPDGDAEFARDQIIARHGIGKIAAVVTGGATRQRSVANALAAAPDDAEYLLTHDGARPLVTPEIIAAALAAAERTGAAIAAIPAADTLKTAREGIITGAIPREGVFQIQTPQCFKADILRQAVARALAEGFEATDEAALAERIGVKVAVAAGSPLNFKITTGADAALAAMLLRANATEPS